MESSRYIKIEDQTVWPIPGNYDTSGTSLEWILRHGTPEEIIKCRMVIASYLNAYTNLINMENNRRNSKCNQIKEALEEKS